VSAVAGCECPSGVAIRVRVRASWAAGGAPVAIVVLLIVEALVARRGPSLAERTVERNATFGDPANPSLTVAWLGDSTAAGVGASGTEGSLPHQVAAAVVAARRGSAAVRLELTVLARSGDRVADVVRDQLPEVGPRHPDVVVVSVGANDTIHATTRSTFRRRYRRLLEGLARAGVPGRRVVWLAQPLRTVVGWRSRELDADVDGIARRGGAGYVDIFRHTSRAFRRHPSRYFARDRYHPNDDGYGLWAAPVVPAVQRALEAAHAAG
jgi:acyl-CoA thioesterase-1